MSRRSVCLVPHGWDKERAAARDCTAREHRHVSLEAAAEMVHAGAAEWIAGVAGVIRECAEGGSLNRLSIQVGEPLAMMVYSGNRVAGQMVREIQNRRRRG